MKRGRTSHFLRLLGAFASVLLFAWMVSRTGLGTILDQTRLLGAGLILLILLSGFRHVLRAVVWQRCIKPEDRNASLLDLFCLRLVGEAITDAAPAGPLMGEPAKVLAASQYMPGLASASSVLTENLIYIFAALLFMLTGVALALLDLATPRRFQWIGGGLFLGLLLSMLLAWSIIVRRTLLVGRILDCLENNGLKWSLLKRYAQHLRALEEGVHDFFANRRGVLFFVLAIEFATNFTGVAEAELILKATTAHSSFLAAYLVESATRAVQFACAFVPFGLGVQEGTAAFTLKAVGYTVSEGVSLAIIRKIRTAFWAGIGLLLAGKFSVVRAEERGVS
jgi:hypothetical protein